MRHRGSYHYQPPCCNQWLALRALIESCFLTYCPSSISSFPSLGGTHNRLLLPARPAFAHCPTIDAPRLLQRCRKSTEISNILADLLKIRDIYVVGEKGPNWGPAFLRRRHKDAVITFHICEMCRLRWMTCRSMVDIPTCWYRWTDLTASTSNTHYPRKNRIYTRKSD